jgi:ABC-type dipeptide/oligopeptide/nickel transport system ATPase component
MQNQQGSSNNRSISLPSNWSSIEAYDHHLIKHAIDRAFKDGKVVLLTGDSGVGKSVLANKICPDSLLEETAIRKAMLHDKPITSKAIPIAIKGELLIDEAQLLCRESDWNNFINVTKSHEMKVLVVAQQASDLPHAFLASPDVVKVHITKPICK